MAKKTVDRMSIDELTAEIVRLSNERDALREQQKAYSDRRDVLLTEQYTRERLTAAGFAPEQVDAMARVNTIDVSAKEEARNG